MAPVSGRKQKDEAPPPPPVDPLCKHAADVPPDAVGGFTRQGDRITTPSGAVFRIAGASSYPDSSASRHTRSLVGGALLFASADENQALLPAKVRVADRLPHAPAPASIHKNAPPALSSFLTEKICFEEAPQFIADANSLNAESTFQKVQASADKASCINFTATAKQTLKNGVASVIPPLMRFSVFDQARTCNDFPRFTAVVANREKNHSPLRRACTFVAALLALRGICDAGAQPEQSLPTSEKFSFENKMKENISGVANTFRHGVVPSVILNNFASSQNKFVATLNDGPRSVILHQKGHYWKIPTTATTTLASVQETAALLSKQILNANSAFDFSGARKNDIDFADLSRCSSIAEFESLLNLVGGVCAANRECLSEVFSSCGFSLSFVNGHQQQVSAPSSEGIISLAPFAIAVDETDGTVTMTVSCSFINDSCAAAIIHWVVRVAGEIEFDENNNNNSNNQQQQQNATAPEEGDEQEKDPELVEVIRIKASTFNMCYNPTTGALETRSTPDVLPSPSRQGMTRRNSTPNSRQGSAPIARHPSSPNTKLANTNATYEQHTGSVTNENGNLERVTIALPTATLVPEAKWMTTWVPRTIRVPRVNLLKTSSHEFTVSSLRDAKSLYFGAALALWDFKHQQQQQPGSFSNKNNNNNNIASSNAFPPDVLIWGRSRASTEPFLHLCRSPEIDSFLQAARTAGQPALGPLHHDLAYLHKQAQISFETIRAKSNPIISVLAAMSALKMIDHQAETVSRFGNPVIVVGELEDGIIDQDQAAIQNGKYLHQPMTPLSRLFGNENQQQAFSLQISKNIKIGQAAASALFTITNEYSCIFTAAYEFAEVQSICRAITGYASVVDKYYHHQK